MKKETYKITEEKKFELIEEMKNLQEVKLEEIADRLEQSRNDDFNDDDIQLGEILEERETVETRIDEISEILNNAEIIKDKDYCEPNLVAIGSTVKLKQDKKIFDVKLVSSLEANPDKSYISDKSPLGKALLKSKSGDTVKVKIRGNTTEYKVLEVC